ncbi:hypothetical protein RIF29_19818 [Crotalaria pallida]|uniref:Uncharacterized protein n=1 Tax=Crotalaria pallida TaxID=3830 RepID=A0AAN9F1X8_CROPI
MIFGRRVVKILHPLVPSIVDTHDYKGVTASTYMTARVTLSDYMNGGPAKHHAAPPTPLPGDVDGGALDPEEDPEEDIEEYPEEDPEENLDEDA